MSGLIVKKILILHPDGITSQLVRRRLFEMPWLVQRLDALNLSVCISHHRWISLFEGGAQDLCVGGWSSQSQRVALSCIVHVR